MQAVQTENLMYRDDIRHTQESPVAGRGRLIGLRE
jgi:hypothetical protein